MDHFLLLVVVLLLRFFPLFLQEAAGLYRQHLPVGVHRQQFEKFVSNFDQQGQNSVVVDEVEADSQNFGDIVTEHVGHEHIRVLPLAHIHGIGDIADHVEVGIEELEPRVEKIDLKLLLLLPVRLPRQNLIDQLEMRSLHHLHHPTKTELHPIPLHLSRRLRSLLLVLGASDLQGPTAQQQILDDVMLGHFRGLPEDAVEDQLDHLLEFDL